MSSPSTGQPDPRPWYRWIEIWYVAYALVGMVGLGLIRFLIPLVVDRGGSATQVGLVVAAEVEINWVDPASYSDIMMSSSDTKKAFDKRVSSQLEGHMAKLAKALPDDQKLVMNFTNVALAGNIDPVRGAETARVVQGNRYPAGFAFDYMLQDASGNVLKQGSENLKSSTGTVRTAKPGAYGIEKKLLTDWFNKTFK